MTGNITMFPWLFFFFLACLFSYLHPSVTWRCIPCFSLSGSCQSNIWKAGHPICIMSLWKKPLKNLTSYCIDIKVVFADQGSRNRRRGTKIFQVQITKFEGKMKNKTKKNPQTKPPQNQYPLQLWRKLSSTGKWSFTIYFAQVQKNNCGCWRCRKYNTRLSQKHRKLAGDK